MKILLQEIHWLAGLLEGEGSFIWHQGQRDQGRPRIQLQMTDLDVMERACALLGSPLCGPYNSKQKKVDGTSKKETYYTALSGSNAAGWMMTLFTVMGERRKSQIEPILLKWRALG